MYTERIISHEIKENVIFVIHCKCNVGHIVERNQAVLIIPEFCIGITNKFNFVMLDIYVKGGLMICFDFQDPMKVHAVKTFLNSFFLPQHSLSPLSLKSGMSTWFS